VQLWKSLNEFERYFGDDNLNVNQREIVHSARDALCIQTAAQHQLNLAKAIRNRNEETLSHVIYQVCVCLNVIAQLTWCRDQQIFKATVFFGVP